MVRISGLRARVLNGGLVDLLMLATVSGRERDAGQWRALLSRAGFHIMKIWPTRCPLSIIQAIDLMLSTSLGLIAESEALKMAIRRTVDPLELVGSHQTIVFSEILGRCPRLRELGYDVRNAVVAPGPLHAGLESGFGCILHTRWRWEAIRIGG